MSEIIPAPRIFLLCLALLALVAVCAISPRTRAQNDAPAVPQMNPGDLDATFDSDGRVTTDFEARGDIANAVTQQADGKTIAVGYMTRSSNNFRAFAVTRYNTDGALDTTFGSGGRVVTDFDTTTLFNAEAQEVALQPDGKIVVVGYAGGGSMNFLTLARYLPDGQLDTAFDGDGKVSTRFDNLNCQGYALALLSDGSILVAGWQQVATGNDDFLLARYRPDGSVDTTFGTGGRVTTDFNGSSDRAFDMVMQTDGKVILGGQRSGSQLGLARYNADGTPDTSFGSNGRVTEGFPAVRALALQADGKLLLVHSSALARYQANGTPDTPFGLNGRLSLSQGTSVAVQANGKIVAASTPSSSFVLDVFNSNGTRDNSFGSGGRVTTTIGIGSAAVNDLLIQPDNKIVAVGAAFNGSTDFALARYFGAGDGGCSYAISPDRQVFLAAGGVGTTINVTAPAGCAWTSVSNSGFLSLTSGFNGNGNGAVTFMVSANSATTARTGTLTIAGRTFTAAQLGLGTVPTTAGRLDLSFDFDGFVTTDFNESNDEGNALALQPDGKIVVVGTASNSLSVPVAFRYLPDGTLDSSFGNGGKTVLDFSGTNGTGGTGLAVALQTDGKILVAGVSSNPSFTGDFALARLLPNGALDTSFGVGGKVITDFNGSSDSINALAVQSDGKIVAAGIAGGVSGTDFALARYDSNGNLDASFGISGKALVDFSSTNDEARAVALQNDGGLIVTGRTFITNIGNGTALARVLPNGTLDTNFGNAGRTISTGGEARDLLLQPDGKILVVGEQFVLFRYLANGSPDVGFGISGKSLIRPLSGSGFNQMSAFGLALQSDNRILLGGFCSSSGINFCLARTLPNGTVDGSFGTDGFINAEADAGGTESARDIALLPNGNILLVGSRNDPVTQANDVALARFLNGDNCTYSIQPTSYAFPASGGSGTVNVTAPAGCAWTANAGTATFANVTGGANGTGNGTVTFTVSANTSTNNRNGALNVAGQSVSVAQLNPTVPVSGPGSSDFSFDFDGAVTTNFHYRSDDTANAMMQQPDGKLLLAGSVGGGFFNGSSIGFPTDFGLARYNPDGSLDNSFGAGGKVTTEITSSPDEALAIALQGDGKIVVAGQAPVQSNLRSDIVVVRYLPDGALDRSFGNNGIVLSNINNRSSSGRAAAIQPDGKIVVAGAANVGTDNDDFVVLRYNADGTPDTSFSGGRVLTDFENRNDQVNALAILPDGKIIAAGYETIAGQVIRCIGLVRYNANGTLDQTFGTGGKVITRGGFATDLIVYPDGRLLAAGGSESTLLARYLPNGQPDGSFGVNGKVALSNVLVMKLQDDGKILTAGGLTLQRRHADGAPDLSFGVNGLAQIVTGNSGGTIRGLALQPGYIILGGTTLTSAINNDFMLARVNDGPSCTYSLSANGQIFASNGGTSSVTVRTQNGCAWSASATAANFVTLNSGSTGNGSGAVTFTVNGNTAATSRSGVLTIAGQQFLVEQRGLNAPANAPGALDASFDSDGRVTANYFADSTDTMNDLAIQADGRIVAVGSAEQGSGRSMALMRFNPDGSLDGTFGFGGRAASNFVSNDVANSVALQSDGKIVLGGFPGFALVRYQTDGSLDTTFGAGGYVRINIGGNLDNEFVSDVVIQSSGKILAVGSAQVNTSYFATIVRFNPDGSVDSTFGTDGKVLANFNFGLVGGRTALVLGDDKIILVARGIGSSPTSTFDFIVARFEAHGALDLTFGTNGFVTTDLRTNGNDEGYDIALQEDGKFIVSGVSSNATNTQLVAARYQPNGSLDTSFGTGGRVVISDFGASFASSTMVLQSDGKILLGSATFVGRLNANGTKDTTFGNNGFVMPFPSSISASCNALGVQPDGKIIVGGTATLNTLNNRDFALARIFGGTGDGLTLAGRLTDSHNRALRDVPVTLSGAAARVTATDALGNYSLTDLKAGGDYTVKSNSASYLTTPARHDFTNLTASQTGVNFTADAAVLPPVTTPLADDFNGSRDVEKWSIGTLTRAANSFDAGATVAQANGQLLITPRSNLPDAHFNGYSAVNNFDFTNGAVSVELVQAANGGGETGFAVGTGPEFYFRFAVLPYNANPSQPEGNAPAAESPLLVMQVRNSGQFKLLSVPYNPSAHRLLRLRHIPETVPPPANNASPGGYVVFEASAANPVNYSELFRIAVGPRSLAQMSAELSAGTSNPVNAPGQAIFDNFAAVSHSSAQFAPATYTVSEAAASVTVTVTRTGDTTTAASVAYATAGGTAQAGARYLQTSGTLNFASNETSKSFTLPVLDNALTDGTQTVEIVLSNARGTALNSPARAIVTITDNDTPGATNPVEDAQFFVRQQYYDFLNRAPDAGGLEYWTGQITQCGADANCIRGRRIGVSAAFFVELEFQETGYVVYRFHRAAFGTLAAPGQTRANLFYDEFSSDRAQIIGGPVLEQSTQEFAARFVQRERFTAEYPLSLSNAQFVNKLFDKANLTPFTSERQAEIAAMESAGRSRDQVLLNIINLAAFRQREYNPSFVLMQYFGYLRRDPDQDGYDFWLNILNQQPNNFRGMVCAFITSAEYQLRFGTQTPRSNAECVPGV